MVNLIHLFMQGRMKYYLYWYIVACFIYYPTLRAEAVITFFIQPYPEFSRQTVAQEMSAGLKAPGKIDFDRH